MLILREIAEDDLDDLVSLAEQLDSMNLPRDPDFLAERITLSRRSFGKQPDDWREGVYVFVLEDTETGRCIGTSTIMAKHGRPGRPYFWLAVNSHVAFVVVVVSFGSSLGLFFGSSLASRSAQLCGVDRDVKLASRSGWRPATCQPCRPPQS